MHRAGDVLLIEQKYGPLEKDDAGLHERYGEERESVDDQIRGELGPSPVATKKVTHRRPSRVESLTQRLEFRHLDNATAVARRRAQSARLRSGFHKLSHSAAFRLIR